MEEQQSVIEGGQGVEEQRSVIEGGGGKVLKEKERGIIEKGSPRSMSEGDEREGASENGEGG